MATFTEFCCRSSTGSNLNAGSLLGDTTVPSGTPFKSYVSGTWVAATGVFTVASGDPVTDLIVAGQFASVYPDAATVTPFVGRITARDATTITVSLTAKMGTAPVDGTTNTTLTVGGAWKGPNGASGFPFNVIQNTLTNAAGNFPRVNFMNDATYAITAAMTHTNAGPIPFQGFTASYGDLGKATVDGTIVGASYILLNVTGAVCPILDFIFQNNGTTGSANGLQAIELLRVVVNNVRGTGMKNASGSAYFVECETYACNLSNTSNLAGFEWNDRGFKAVRCIAHDNTGSNADGFNSNNVTGGVFMECIADSNGRDGFGCLGTNTFFLHSCDAYNNGRDGLRAGNATTAEGYLENCNFIKNTGWGILQTAGVLFIANCGFGSGTQANVLGTTSVATTTVETGSVTYASGATPWNAPTTGDFTITLAAAKNAGRGTFTQTQASYTGSLGKPDIGAAAAAASGGGLPMSASGVI